MTKTEKKGSRMFLYSFPKNLFHVSRYSFKNAEGKFFRNWRENFKGVMHFVQMIGFDHRFRKLQKCRFDLWVLLANFFGIDSKIGFFFRARQKGYRVHCGRWLVEGNPQVVLFDIASASQKMNDFKQELYDKAGIGIPHEDVETNDVTIFG